MVSCDRLWEVDALREGRLGDVDAASFERHRAQCAVCATRWHEDEALRELGRRLPVPPADALLARRRRAQLLRDAAVPARRRRPIAVAAFAIAIAAAVALIWTANREALLVRAPRIADALEPAATVRASSGATWSIGRAGGIEIVSLVAGTLVVEVPRQHDGERFVVVLPDGFIEVRGTVFEVSANGGATVAVEVREGIVALRRGETETLLRAGDVWPAEPPKQAAPSPPASAATPAAPRVPLARPSASTSASTEYEEAMSLYRARSYAAAARAFHAFAAAHPRAPEAEDAAFLEAASLAFAGRADAAALVAERFLALHPRSFHARDAAVLVARAARDRGDCEAARRVVAPWIAAGGADVTSALGKCAP